MFFGDANYLKKSPLLFLQALYLKLTQQGNQLREGWFLKSNRIRFQFSQWVIGVPNELTKTKMFIRWGWVFLERTRILSGIQFTTHFIDFFVVETKTFVGGTVNVILTRQTCGQRSSKAAESKRRALENSFPGRICYLFPISKCRGD